MAGALATIRDRIAKGRSNSFRYPVYGSGNTGGGGYASWNDWLINRLLPSSDFDYVTEAGDLWKNAVISAALRFLLSTFPEPTLVVKRAVPDTDSEDKDGITEEDVRDHPLLALLDTPNEDDDDSTALAQAFCLDFNLWGNAYWLMLRNGAGRVVGIQPIPYRMMQPAADPTGRLRVAAYVYFVDGHKIPYPTQDIIHFRFGRDPNNARKGFEPLTGACRDICTENELSTLAASVARNHGIVPYLVSPMSDDVQAVIPKDQKDQLQEEFDGRTRDRRGLTMIMRRAFKVDKIGLSPDELMADKSRAVAVTRILGPLGLDALVLGLPSESKTFDNYGEAKKGAYDHNIIPVGDAYCTRLTRTFRREPGYLQPNERLAWDYSNVAALQEDQDALLKRWGDFYKVGGCTRLEAKQKVGLPYDDTRDDVYIQDIITAQQQMSLDAQAEMQDNKPAPAKLWQIKSGDSHWITIEGQHVEIGGDGKPKNPEWRERLGSDKPAGPKPPRAKETAEEKAARTARIMAKLPIVHANLPALRERVAKDLKGAGLTKDRVAAAITHIMDTTTMRVGSEEYATKSKRGENTGKSQDSFGASSLRKSHVTVEGDTVRMKFPGKSRKDWDRSIDNADLAQVVRELHALPGERLMQHVDDKGIHEHNETHVRDYMKPHKMTPKNLRTYHGSRIADEELEKMGPAATPEEAEKNIGIVVKKVSNHLGNTPAIARESYINPAVLERYRTKTGDTP